MNAVIMAGGKGSRLFSVTGDIIPKPMVLLCNRPLLEYQIECLKKNGITDIILVVGHLHEKIRGYFGNGNRHGVKIEYIVEEEPLGTAGAFYYLRDYIKEDFVLIFGDVLFNMDLQKVIDFHKKKSAKITLTIHPNDHPYDSDIVIVGKNDLIEGFDSKHNIRKYDYKNLVNAGIYVISPDILLMCNDKKKMDLEHDIILKLIIKKNVYGYQTPEVIMDIGTPERLEKGEKIIITGVLEKKNLLRKQKCVFLDRDGTVNKLKGLLYRKEDLELEDTAADAIRILNQSEYLAIVATNQPVIARNLCNIEYLEVIHKRLETLLGEKGAYLDDIIFCPHHPDSGYPEENPEYKIKCDCRKPGIGMIEIMEKKYNIDLSRSYIIGDTTTDIMTGINAGLKTVLVNIGEKGKDEKYSVRAYMEAANLIEAVKNIVVN